MSLNDLLRSCSGLLLTSICPLQKPHANTRHKRSAHNIWRADVERPRQHPRHPGFTDQGQDTGVDHRPGRAGRHLRRDMQQDQRGQQVQLHGRPARAALPRPAHGRHHAARHARRGAEQREPTDDGIPLARPRRGRQHTLLRLPLAPHEGRVPLHQVRRARVPPSRRVPGLLPHAHPVDASRAVVPSANSSPGCCWCPPLSPCCG